MNPVVVSGTGLGQGGGGGPGGPQQANATTCKHSLNLSNI